MKTAVPNRNRHGASQQRSFNVRRHVVWPFVGVDKIRRVFGGQFVKMALHILPNCWIGVFVDGQGCGGVLNEDVGQSHLKLTQFWKLPNYFGRYQMKAACFGR